MDVNGFGIPDDIFSCDILISFKSVDCLFLDFLTISKI